MEGIHRNSPTICTYSLFIVSLYIKTTYRFPVIVWANNKGCFLLRGAGFYSKSVVGRIKQKTQQQHAVGNYLHCYIKVVDVGEIVKLIFVEMYTILHF